MNRRQELCRNFQRGSCQYGDRCKFLHATQQQPKPNPFGFGTQNTPQPLQTTQQQKPNPFGFGVSNNSQLRGAPNSSAGYQSPTKPFENKWTRSLANSTPSQQNDTQPQTANHKCTDPESCKRIIAEDYKNEAPMWKLTCYAHFKYLPCDIVGDTSFEELRAAAYEDARRGLNLQSIVERERNLLNSKLLEFDNLLRNPYVPRCLSSAGMPETSSNSPFPATQSNATPSFSSFSQLGTSNSSGPGIRSPPVTPSSMVFGQPSLSQNTSQTARVFGVNFGVPGVVGSQPPTQPSSTPSFGNGLVPNGNKGFPFPLSQQFPSSTNQPFSSHGGLKVAPPTLHEASNEEEKDDGSDHSIWLKEEWNIGEIPDQEPPLRFC